MKRSVENAGGSKIFTPANVVVAVAVVAVLMASFAAIWAGAGGSSESLCAVVHDSTGAEYRLSLDEDTTLTVSTDEGTNVIAVEDGAVRVVDADCDGHDCLHQGAISSPGAQIICLPHKLWIEVVAEGEASGNQMDVEAVSGDGGGIDVLAR